MKENLYDLTAPQKSIYVTEQYYNGSAINNVCGTAIVEQILDFAVLKQAINLVIQNNDSFQLRLSKESGEIKQYLSSYSPIDISIVDIQTKTEIEIIEKEMMSHVFDIMNSDLFEFKIFRLPDNSGGFILNIHHLLADSWTLGLTAREIVKTYSCLKNGLSIEKSDGCSYLNYIYSEQEYKQSNKFEKDKEYWSAMYLTVPEVATIPSISSETSSDISCTSNRKTFKLTKSIMSEINNYCSKNNLSLFNFFMAIFSIYLSKVSCLDDFVIGTPILNRTNFKEKNTTGMFINIAPLRIQVDSNLDFKSFATKISKDSISMLRHQRYSYQYILEDLRKLDASIPNLYNILISYQITKANTEQGLSYETRWAFNGNTSDDLDIHLYDINDSGNIDISYDYKISKYNENDITGIHNRILNMIKQVIEISSITLNEIDIITPYEKDELLVKFNDTSILYNPSQNTIKQFEEQVKINPLKIALIFENEKITYKELNDKANQLAWYLINSGVKQGNLVGILINRSLEMIIGLIGILKAGAAYLPLDPEYPTQRISYILDNSKAILLLVHDETFNLVPDTYDKINIDLNSNLYSSVNISNPNIEFDPNSLMYTIYTSGSTGNPKGVMVTHKNVTNFILGITNIIDFNPNKIMVSLTTICFDIFGLELWCSLTHGLSVVIANSIQQSNAKAFNELCIKYNVNMVQTTPSRFNMLLEESSLDYLKNITDIMVGGESFPKILLDKMKNYSNANIYNMYGPTETTIWSTVKDLTNDKNITIGRPIANTKCYVLGKNKELLPKNTIGELYIGGDGVSNGYLYREELNKEKFVTSSFDDKLIYNTNDLAYFNDSGDIVHLGRSDFQVKIRGYRIELGEIEHYIISFEGIKNAVVIANNNKFLVCYYTSEKEIEESSLTNYLLKYLPNYMVPSLYKKIDAIPLTPNGKIDRKKLPPINCNVEVELANTKTEKVISSILQKILDIDMIDINSPFLSIGLDSLGIIQAQTLLIPYGINLTTQDFYKFPSVKLLAKRIDSNTVIYSEVDSKIPELLLHSNNPINFASNQDVLGNVFLTGANGFIGIHILHELLISTDSKVYCLVRGENYEHSVNRLLDTYSFYFNKDLSPLIHERIFILNGNIIDNSFNLLSSEFNDLINNIHTIIHTAAIVKHYGDFAKFKAANINGTKQISNFAYTYQKRLIHISSISVSGNYLVKQDNRNIDFSENDLYIGQHYTDNVYVNSKFEAEKIVYSYIEKGLKAEILRIGIIAGRYTDGVFQKNISDNAFYSRIKSIVKLSCVSNTMLSQKIEFTPVDYCAKAIVLLAKSSIAENKVFHLYNNNLSTIESIIKNIKNFHINVNILSAEEFETFLLKISQDATNNVNLKGIVNDISFNQDKTLNLNYNFSVNIQSDYTQKYLDNFHFSWPKIDNTYIRRILQYMRDVNFI